MGMVLLISSLNMRGLGRFDTLVSRSKHKTVTDVFSLSISAQQQYRSPKKCDVYGGLGLAGLLASWCVMDGLRHPCVWCIYKSTELRDNHSISLSLYPPPSCLIFHQQTNEWKTDSIYFPSVTLLLFLPWIRFVSQHFQQLYCTVCFNEVLKEVASSAR